MLLLGIAIGLLILGVFMTCTGLWPRRRGTTPRCRECHYNLTGTDVDAADARCPECGTRLRWTETVVLGERRVRRVRLVTGIACTLMGIAILVITLLGYAWNVSWYSYAPTSWVLSDLESSDTSRAAKAWREIDRRWTNATLSQAHIAQLADIALAEQARPEPRSPVLDHALDTLYALYQTASLSEEQTQRFYAQLVRLSMSVRQRVVRGQEFIIWVERRCFAPNGRFGWCLTVGETRLSNEVLWRGGTPSHVDPLGTWGGARGHYVSAEQTGCHTLAQDVTVRVFSAASINSPSSDAVPLYEVSQTFTTTIEVLPEDEPDLVRLVSTPELDEQVVANVQLWGFYVRDSFREGCPSRSCLEGTVQWTGVRPVPLVFDVLVEMGGREIPIGHVAIAPGGSAMHSHAADVSGDADETLPDQATIILHSSRSTALRETTFDEIWSGELRFENVQLPDLSKLTTSPAHFTPYSGKLVRPTSGPAG